MSKVSVLKGKCSTSATHSGTSGASFLTFSNSPLEKSAPTMSMSLARGVRKRPLPQPASRVSVLRVSLKSSRRNTDSTSA